MESMMTARQVAELLGVHENWVYDQAAAGELPSYKIGGTRRFDPDELNGWIADHREPEHRREPRRRRAQTGSAASDARRTAKDGKRQLKAAAPPSGGDQVQPRLFE